MEQLGLPEFTSEQIEELCNTAEEAARKYVLSKIPSKKVEVLNVSAEAEGTRPIQLTVDVELALTGSSIDEDAQRLTDEAVRDAFSSAEKYLKGLTCSLRKS